MSEQTRVLVVDDDPHIISALTRVLSYEGYAVDVAYDGKAALARLREQAADLVVLDRMLPGMDGIEVCEHIRAEFGEIAVLMLTAKDGVPERVRGLDSGADDYLVKPYANEELLSRMRALLRRKPPGTGRILRFADVELNRATHEAKRGGQSLDLTPKEFDLLEYFLRHPRQVLERQQLIDEVWGLDTEASSNVVDVYVGYLREKLEATDRARLLQTVRGVGFVVREEP
jgi:two-component system response regulator MprA